MIRLNVPSIGEEEIAAVREVLESGFLVQGQRVAMFEERVAGYVGLRYAVAVSNCTGALHLSLIASGVRPGDIVVVTAYSWISTANVIEICGAQPVFVDIKADTFNMDPDALERTLSRLMATRSTACRVKAILPVHTFGQLADMPAIMSLAHEYDLPVIEDAACALGAKLSGKQAGRWGLAGCFSFHPRKAITTGEGGIIVTDDSGLATRLRSLRNQGMDPDGDSVDFIMPGFNYRMTEFQAAMGTVQMEKVDRIIAARRRLATTYDKLLAGSPVNPPAVRSDSDPVYQSYVVLLPEQSARHRDVIIEHMKAKGIEVTIGTYHMPMTRYFRSKYGFGPADFAVAQSVFTRALTLPLHEKISEGEQGEVVRELLLSVE